MNTQKIINKVVWAVTAGIMVSTIALYATTEQSDGHQYGEQTRQQSEQSQKQQMHLQSRQTSTQAGVLCRLNDLLGSDVKSSMQQDSKALGKGNEQQENARDRGEQRDIFAWSNDDDPNATLGTVKELILDDQKHEVRYVILKSDNQNYLIPWQAFHVKRANVRSSDQIGRYNSDVNRPETQQPHGASGQRQDPAGSPTMSNRGLAASSKTVLYLNLSKQQLKQSPTMDSISVEAVSNSQLQQRVDSFYAEHIRRQVRQFEGAATRQIRQQESSPQASQQQQQATRGEIDQRPIASGRMLKATDIVGLKLKSTQDNNDLGTIKDMVVDTREGQIAYGLVHFGGFMGMGQKIGVVPWTLVTIDANLDYARIDATKEQLSAAVLENDNIDKLSEAQFAKNIHTNFNAQPYWQIYGYVPAEGDTPESREDDDWQRKHQQQKEQQ